MRNLRFIKRTRQKSKQKVRIYLVKKATQCSIKSSCIWLHCCWLRNGIFVAENNKMLNTMRNSNTKSHTINYFSLLKLHIKRLHLINNSVARFSLWFNLMVTKETSAVLWIDYIAQQIRTSHSIILFHYWICSSFCIHFFAVLALKKKIYMHKNGKSLFGTMYDA